MFMGDFVPEQEENFCNFRPSESLSPKQKLQEPITGLGSSVSLRRPKLGFERQILSLRREWLA